MVRYFQMEEVKMNDKIKSLEGRLIVSCQALENEPLHSDFIMGRMALAAKEGGACGIRANTIVDIKEIQRQVDLPIIGIIKRVYPDSEVYITPTMDEVDALVNAGVDIIALDATNRPRPNNRSLKDFFGDVRAKYPDVLFMADCSTEEEAIFADELGFDFIGTTMVGYTKESEGLRIEENDFEILRNILAKVKHKVIAEGNINTPEKCKRVIELGAFSVVVGSIITRPQLITREFSKVLEKV
jgi:putative N-acylglucosamine-6-phosphate 2-epimerase